MLRVIYLVFNEGYFASVGEMLGQVDLTGEAIRLGRLLAGPAAGNRGYRAAGVDAASQFAPRRADLARG